MKYPNFFIIGAPKCGTSAMSEYLKSHPDVCFSDPKEPHYFATDLPDYRQKNTYDSYKASFNCGSKKYLRVGEGSTWYLYSSDAVGNILEYNPSAKLIAMVRNPLVVAESLYRQFVYGYEENAATFEEAWHLQDARRKGQNIPKYAQEPKRLQYKEVCALGTQLERLMNSVPNNQLKIIVFDDFIADTKKTYEEVLVFLDLPSDNRMEFQKVNERKAHRFKLIAKLTSPSKRMDKVIEIVKRYAGIKRLGISDILLNLNRKKVQAQPLSSEFKQVLYDSFKSEINKMESLLNRDFSNWRKL